MRLQDIPPFTAADWAAEYERVIEDFYDSRVQVEKTLNGKGRLPIVKAAPLMP